MIPNAAVNTIFLKFEKIYLFFKIIAIFQGNEKEIAFLKLIVYF